MTRLLAALGGGRSDSHRGKRFSRTKPPVARLEAAQSVAGHRVSAKNSYDLWSCPKCGGPMVVIDRFTAADIQLRSPPLLTSAA